MSLFVAHANLLPAIPERMETQEWGLDVSYPGRTPFGICGVRSMGQGRWKSKKRAHMVEPTEEGRRKFWFSGVS